MFDGTLVGIVTSEIKVRSDKNGNRVYNFDVADNRKINGGKETTTEFINVAAFGAVGEACGKYLSKGRRVAVKLNKIQAKAYMGKDGTPRAKIHARADTVEFCDKVEVVIASGEIERPAEQTPYLENAPEMPDGFISVDASELPF